MQGLALLAAPQHDRPWLISGNGRSGTTAVVAIVRALGMPVLGRTRGNQESHEFGEMVKREDMAAIAQFRARSWIAGTCIKVPGLAARAAKVSTLAEILDCNYLLVVRDAVAESHYDLVQHPSMHRGEAMRGRANMTWDLVTSAIQLSVGSGVVMLSYEKLIQPAANWALIQELARLLGCPAENTQLGINALQVQSADYRAAVERGLRKRKSIPAG